MPATKAQQTQMRGYRIKGLDKHTIRATATQFWGLTPKETRREERRFNRDLALEATSMDILGELMLIYHQKCHIVDNMSRQAKNEDLPASFFNTQRLLLNDCESSLISIAEMREKTGRDRSKPPEKAVERKKEEKRLAEVNFETYESGRATGYFYDNAHGLMQPGNDLLSEQVAIRDVLRMRMLPKSQYEDYMIAQLLGALTEDEKKLDPETLSKEEVVTDLHTWDPMRHAIPGQTKYKEEEKLAQLFFLKRVQEYNEVWAKAEQHVDGLLVMHQIQPGMRYPFVGLPLCVKKAAEGDEQAIAQLQIMVAAAKQQTPEYVNQQVAEHSKLFNLEKITSAALALFLAFSTIWTCMLLIMTPQAHGLRPWVEPAQAASPLNVITMNADEEIATLIETSVQQVNTNHPNTPCHRTGSRHTSVPAPDGSLSQFRCQDRENELNVLFSPSG